MTYHTFIETSILEPTWPRSIVSTADYWVQKSKICGSQVYVSKSVADCQKPGPDNSTAVLLVSSGMTEHVLHHVILAA